MTLRKELYGKMPDGRSIEKFTFANSKGLSAEVITYGGILTSLQMPDRRGKSSNITLGFDTLEQYIAGSAYFGAILGRFANRISKGKFTLDGVQYSLSCNETHGAGAAAVAHHLHGGNKGCDKAVWKAKGFQDKKSAGVTMSYLSLDGEEGYPGNLRITVVYRLAENDELSFEYRAKTDKPGPVNLSQHSYWNLAGSGTIMDHELELNCPFYLPVDQALIPTGEVLSVKGTPMNFTSAKPIGRDIGKVSGGYDHCWVAGRSERPFKLIGKVYEPSSGRGMEIWTTKPGIQFYSGNFLNALAGTGGAVYNRHSGLCLESELFPDAVNQPHFPSCILRPGQTYNHMTVHRFFIK